MSQNEDLQIGILDLIRALEPNAAAAALPAFVQKLRPESFLRLELIQAESDVKTLIVKLSNLLDVEDEDESLLARAQVELALQRIRAGGGILGFDQSKNLVIMDHEQKSTYSFDLTKIGAN